MEIAVVVLIALMIRCGLNSPHQTAHIQMLKRFQIKPCAELRILLLVLLGLAVGGCSGNHSSVNTNPPSRVLFVGNSFTYYNGGLETHVKQLALAANPKRHFETDRATKGGATLKILNDLPFVHDKIRSGNYDVVVLQEDIPELKEHSAETFFEHARRFNEEIRNVGSRTILFMAWPYERLNWVTQEEILKAHRQIGKELELPVAPVGLAFQRSLAARPELAMLGRDKEHETIHGTYLAACMIHATLFGTSPVGLAYRPAGVSPNEATFLQRIAWETVLDWKKHP